MAVVLFIIEVGTPTAFFFACLGVGAALASLATIFGVPWLPWVVFILSSPVLVVLSRPLANRILKFPSRRANVDAIINQRAYVIDDITPKKFGRVKIGGEEWLAESGEEIKKGEWVVISSVNGVKLVVKKTSG